MIVSDRKISQHRHAQNDSWCDLEFTSLQCTTITINLLCGFYLPDGQTKCIMDMHLLGEKVIRHLCQSRLVGEGLW